MIQHPLFTQLAELPETFPGICNIPADVAYLLGCGSQAQFDSTLKTIVDPGRFCAFCEHNWHKRTMLCHSADWAVVRNDFKGNGQGGDPTIWYLIIPARHITRFDQLVPYDGAQIIGLVQEANQKLALKGGMLAARFDHPAHHVGTVPHFHINLISPDGNTEVRVPIGKLEEQHAKNWPRLRTHIAAHLLHPDGFAALFA